MGMVRRRTRRRTMMVAGGLAYERGQNAARPPKTRPTPSLPRRRLPRRRPPPNRHRPLTTQRARSSGWRHSMTPAR